MKMLHVRFKSKYWIDYNCVW